MKTSLTSLEYPLVIAFNHNKHSYIYDARTKLLTKLEHVIKDEIALKQILTKYLTFIHPAGISNIVPSDKYLKDCILPSFRNFIPRKFILEITDECTLRCKYCFFSNNESLRKHAKNHISLNIAFKAIDYYYNLYTSLFKRISPKNREKVLKLAPPGISWWGGEPFTAFDIMKKSLEYFESLKWELFGISKTDFIHSAATNLTILSDEIIDFITSNKILLYISLDGKKREHDLNRVFINGKGSYNKVSKNLDLLVNMYPNYAKQFIIIQSVFANNVTNIKGINELKKKYNIGFENTKIRNWVVNEERTAGHYLTEHEVSYTDYETEISIFEKTITNIETLSSHKLSYIIDKLNLRTELDYLFNLENNIISDYPNPKNEYNLLYSCPACNDVVFISLLGDIHICNRVDYSHSLGDVNNGISESKMYDFFSKYYKGIRNAKCKNCWAFHFCDMCPGKTLYNSEFIYPNNKDCEIIRKGILTQLKKYIILASHRKLYRNLEKILFNGKERKYSPNKPVNVLDYEEN